MDLNKAKKHASKLLGVGKARVWINPAESEKVKKAITKDDLRALINEKVIKRKKKAFQSRCRARKKLLKKRKGLRKGSGKRKGAHGARVKPKAKWIQKTRAQRKKLKELLEKEPAKVKKMGYRKLYGMIKGGFFRGKKHLEKTVLEGKK